MSAAPAPAGWYPDPWGQHERRWWNGTDWTGETQGEPSPAAPDAATQQPRRAARLTKVLVGLALAGAVIAALSFSEGREWMALVAVALVLPLAVWSIVQLATTRPWTRRSWLGVLASWVLVVVVVAAGGYRGFQSTSCLDEVGPDAALAGCDLAGRDLTTYELAGADLTGADLSGADLATVDLTGADLTRANLTGASFGSADLDDAVLREAVIESADFEGASLRNADLSDATLTSVGAAGSDFTGASFAGATLTDVILTGTTLDRTDFSDADLTDVAFEGASFGDTTGLADEQLAGAFNVDVPEVANALTDRGIFLEPLEDTRSRLDGVCAGSPVTGAATTQINGSYGLAFNEGDTNIDWSTVPPALRYVEFVVCIGVVETEDVDECGPYYFEDGSLAHPITRYRENVQVRLISPTTGEVLAEQTFQAPEPDPCPELVSASVYRMGGDLNEGDVQTGAEAMVDAAGL